MDMRLFSFFSFFSIEKNIVIFLKKRFWLVLTFGVISVSAIFFAVFSDEVMARINFANGFYTKVCGDNITPNGDLNGNVFRPADACQNKCDLGAGSCSGNAVFRFECDGKTTDCRSNLQGPSSSQSLNRSGLCGKTVQIDVFKRNCLASGDCNSLPSFDANADLQDFIVWYSGDCAAVSPPASPSPGAPTCNSDVVSLSVSPGTANIGSQINFRISGDASTFINDDFGGGASNCSGNWTVGGSGLTCNASQSGNFIWTHSWRKCEGSFSNCSNTCTKTAAFAVAAVAPAPPAPPAPPPPPAPPVCNDNSVSLSVSPGTANIGSQINFRISGDASTFINDDFGGGASNCSGNWTVGGSGLTCNASQSGNFIWTHSWRKCEGSFSNCSNTCTKTAAFAVAAVAPAVPAPSVDIKANGSDGPITINNNTSATLSWSSVNANSCFASNGWTGQKPLSGVEPTGNMTASRIFTITCSGSGGTATDSVTVNVEAAPLPPSVDIKANGSDGPITINNNTSATLSWSSVNANSCFASNGWTGQKPLSGVEPTGNMTASRIFTITCSGSGGTATDSVTVNVSQVLVGNLTAQKTAANLSDGTGLMEQISADPNEIILFSIQISGSVAQIQDVIVKDVLPAQIKFRGNLKIDNVLSSGDINSGLNIGSVSPGQTKTVTFEAEILGKDKFNFGETKLINSVLVSAANASAFDTAQIVVTKRAVAGAVTDVSTGLTNNLFLDSFFLPLLFASAGIWIFKSRIIKFEEWRDNRVKEYQQFRTDKLLRLKIAQIKAREFLQKRIV